MSLFKTINLTQRSFSPGERVKGTWVEGQAVDTSFKGTAQPASGKALELLPEGKRFSETITVFAPPSLDWTTADPVTQRNGDLVIWEGRRYEVQVAKKFVAHPSAAMHHWELLATRVKEGTA